MLFVEPNGYFSGSPEPRNDRSNVKFRIGQVIKHKRFGYRGVIVGWDRKTKVCLKSGFLILITWFLKNTF